MPARFQWEGKTLKVLDIRNKPGIKLCSYRLQEKKIINMRNSVIPLLQGSRKTTSSFSGHFTSFSC